jgi:Tfp pilus assembly protein PilV
MKPAPLSPHRQTRRSHAGGFVLLEIVIALGLFAFVATSLTGAIDMIARASTLARQEAQVLRHLDSALAQAVHQPKLEPGTHTIPAGDEGIRTTITVTKAELRTREDVLLTHIFHIHVEAVLADHIGEILRRDIESHVY